MTKVRSFLAPHMVIEAVLLCFLLTRKIGKALAAFFSANLTTRGSLSIFYFVFSPIEVESTYSKLTCSAVFPLMINVLAEAVVLRLSCRNVNLSNRGL